MGRFSDISRGPSLNAAFQKYQTWLAKDPGERSTAYQAAKLGDRLKIERVPAWVDPFGAPDTLHYEVLAIASSPAQPAPSPTVLSLLTGRFVDTAPTTGVSLKMKGFKPAKFGLRQLASGANANGQERTSRITGNKYWGYDTDSASSAFGKKTNTETYLTAVSDIIGQPAFNTFLAPGAPRGYFFQQEET